MLDLDKVLAPRAGLAYGLLRLVTGLLFAFHGLQKVFGVFTDSQPPLLSQLGIGGVIELVTGVLIALGIYTRWAAFLASGTMAVAYMQFHWKFQFDENALPALNHGEPAVVYCFVFLFIACQGRSKSAGGGKQG